MVLTRVNMSLHDLVACAPFCANGGCGADSAPQCYVLDEVQTLQLTLRPFDHGYSGPEGADSFLCEEFGRKFWRQRMAFD